MCKIVATTISMVVSGAVMLGVTILILMDLGGRFHDNYEHYAHPVLVWGPAAIGFLTPGVVVWYLDERGYTNAWKIAGTFTMMVVSGVTTYAVELGILLELGRRLQGDDSYYLRHPAMVGVAIIGFLAPGVIVWHLHRKATTIGRFHE